MVFLAFRLYQKYIKKGNSNSPSDANKSTGSKSFTSLKDDDYEPYSKKQ